MTRTLQERQCGRAVLFGAMAVVSAFGTQALGNINIQLRPANQTVNVGSVVGIGVYVVSDSASNQGLAAVQLVFDWQTTFLQMIAPSGVGAVPLLSSNFPSPDPYGLNESTLPQDGNAMYVAQATFSGPVLATPAGTLLTTLRFNALALTPLTPITIRATEGSPPGRTEVFDSTVPNLDVTGTTTGAAVQIIPAPASGILLLFGVTALRRRRCVSVSSR